MLHLLLNAVDLILHGLGAVGAGAEHPEDATLRERDLLELVLLLVLALAGSSASFLTGEYVEGPAVDLLKSSAKLPNISPDPPEVRFVLD